MIEVDGKMVAAHRTSFIEQRDRSMEYQLAARSTINGRFRWTYP
jgi:hypothetical protein